MTESIQTSSPVEATGISEECPVELTALVLCRAATPHLFRDLSTGPKTFTELRATIVDGGASSSRTLAARLKSLESEGYLERRELSDYYRRVEYALSAKGESLLPIIEAMKSFGGDWLKDRDCSGLH
jgi:DNA-binding HxlR family transcriptional regulator